MKTIARMLGINVSSPRDKQNSDLPPPTPTDKVEFKTLGLLPQLLDAVTAQGYTHPTPIQVKAIPHVLEGGDVLGCAQTGTGKTAAFTLPILQLLLENPRPRSVSGARVLVLAPTRELAIQIDDSVKAYGKGTQIRSTVIFGGVGQGPQVSSLRGHPEIIVATPGRLLDLMNQGFIKLNDIKVFVLDEADRMLDMGFIHDIRKVISVLPKERQNLLFSATMPPDIQNLADKILRNPTKVEAAPISSTATLIEQMVYFVDKGEKIKLLTHLLTTDSTIGRTLVFTRTKHGANRVSESLTKSGIRAEAIHGNKSQSARQKALSNFKAGTTRVLVASDIAARGLDIDEVTHVFNLDLPEVPETYVHRIGRTGRAQASGIAIAFCSSEERSELRAIERLIRKPLPVVADHPFVPVPGRAPAPSDEPPRHRGPPRGRGGNQGRSHRPQGGSGRGGPRN